MSETRSRSNRALLLPYVLPYVVYTGIGSLADDRLSPELDYLARLIGTGAALAWAWRHYPALRGPKTASGSVASGVLAGAFGMVLWVSLISPFVSPEATPMSPSAVALRLLATTLLVPLFEEILMRGYVLRLTLQWEQARREGARSPIAVALDQRSIHDVEAGAWTATAVAVATLLFTLGHSPHEWIAAVAYGVLMAALWVRRRDLLSCVVAHATTNLALGLYVVATGSWALW
jgi:membrane protease YdiL (CAAX protease family)